MPTKTPLRLKHRGFTLIELLVVIAIIGLLATITYVALDRARAKARDAKRLADITQVQKLLELYINDKGAYPNATGTNPALDCFGLSGIIRCNSSVNPNWIPDLITDGYTTQLPVDPLNRGNFFYIYAQLFTASPTQYTLIFHLEHGVSDQCGISGWSSRCAP